MLRAMGVMLAVAAVLASLAGAYLAGSWRGSIYEELAGVDRLRSRISALEERVRTLETLLEREKRNVTMLRALLSETNATVTELEQRLEEANKTIAELKLQIENLRAQLEERNQTIRQLEVRVKSLEARLDYAWQQLNNTRARLERLMSAVELAAEWAGMSESPIALQAVRAAPSTVGDLAETLLAGLDTTRDRVTAIIDWVAVNLYYQNDTAARVVDPDDWSIVVRRDIVMLPNETLENQGGDCEDLALLVYALLRAQPLEGERVWLIGFYTFSAGHAAVLVRGDDGLYYIVDPSGAMINREAAYLELVAENQSDGDMYRVWLGPMGISPGTKKFLLNSSIAVIVYDNALLGPLFPSPEWPESLGSDDLSSAIGYWTLTYGTLLVLEYFIVDDTGYHFFDTRTELVEWLENQP